MDSYIYKNISIENLLLDNCNPRFPKSLQGKSTSDIISYMLLDASIIELMLSIGKNGFFPGEQLLVVPINEGKYKVIEGNRRLTALLLLNNPSLANVQKRKIEQVLLESEFKPNKVPCLIFQEETQIRNYLGYRHITGFKEWRLLEKARYLNNLYIEKYSNEPISSAAREIAKTVGSRQDYIKRLLVGFEIYKTIEDEGFYRIKGLDDTTFSYNSIADSVVREQIAFFLGIDYNNDFPTKSLNKENIKKWTHWLFEKNDQNRTRLIGNSSDLNALNNVIGNVAALKAFDERGFTLEKAIELTGELDKNFESAILKAIEYLERADNLVLKVSDFYSNLDEDLKNVQLLAKKIKRSIEDVKDEDEL